MSYTHFDALKRPVVLGDTVLTKGYGKCNMDQIATVVKITPKAVYIDVPYTRWDSVVDPTSVYGFRWDKITGEVKRMKRDSSSFIVINEQLAHNHAEFPELYI